MIETARMLLRVPREEDTPALVAMLCDPAVMGALVRNPTQATARASLARHAGYRAQHGLGFWVAEYDGAIAGWCGLKPGAPDTPIDGEIEIGWIFGTAFQGRGLALEAARATLDWGWANTPAPRIVAITGVQHTRSQTLMRKLGMAPMADGRFDHPGYASDDPMRHSIAYAIARPSPVHPGESNVTGFGVRKGPM